ncbi:MAG: insulinase family protein, partial [Verrucomicrobiae bacterium]|nr:insulinase family protein [Verrucomicrobiae bacterium]
AELPGLASMTMEMLDEGTKKRDALQISDELQLLGAELDTGANPDQCVVTLNALKATLDDALDLFQDVILNPTFPEKELVRLKKERIATIQHEKVTPNSMALRVLPRLLYGEGHPYSTPLTGTGTETSTERMTREDLLRFHSMWFRPGNSTLIVVGDITADSVLPILESKFGKWPAADYQRKSLPNVPLRSGSPIYMIDKPGAEQSVIFAAHLAPPKSNPQERAIEILNTLLGGKFTSRVNMNLRESKHWTYGASTVVFDACGQRPFFAVAPVQTDKTAEAMQEIRKELIEIIGDRPPTPTEVAETKKQAVLELAGRWETMSAVAASLAEMVRFNYPDDYFANYAAMIMALTEEDVARAAKTLVQPDKLVWVIVGDREKIEDDVRKLGFGELKFLDVSAL